MRTIQHHILRPLLGHTHSTRWPKKFEQGRRWVDGVEYYIKPSNKGPDGKSRFGHRVTAICPVCGRHISAGRLGQHYQVHKK